jgi:hypothetical protein
MREGEGVLLQWRWSVDDKMAPKGEDILKGFQVYPFFAVVICDFCHNVAYMTLWIKLYVT